MIRGIYVAASGMSTQMKNQDVISNNLANVDTTGFKRDMQVTGSFSQMLINRIGDQGDQGMTPGVGSISLGSDALGTVTDFSEGNMQPTERELDFAIHGDGFFVVETPQGTRYTRDGSFQLSSQGTLVTGEGYTVMGENGPMELGSDSRLSGNGEVVESGATVNRMLVVNLSAGDIEKQGETLYRLNETAGVETLTGDQYDLAQGFLETSNVNPVNEMVNMISGLRSYEANQRALVSQDSTLEKLINQALQV